MIGTQLRCIVHDLEDKDRRKKGELLELEEVRFVEPSTFLAFTKSGSRASISIGSTSSSDLAQKTGPITLSDETITLLQWSDSQKHTAIILSDLTCICWQHDHIISSKWNLAFKFNLKEQLRPAEGNSIVHMRLDLSINRLFYLEAAADQVLAKQSILTLSGTETMNITPGLTLYTLLELVCTGYAGHVLWTVDRGPEGLLLSANSHDMGRLCRASFRELGIQEDGVDVEIVPQLRGKDKGALPCCLLRMGVRLVKVDCAGNALRLAGQIDMTNKSRMMQALHCDASACHLLGCAAKGMGLQLIRWDLIAQRISSLPMALSQDPALLRPLQQSHLLVQGEGEGVTSMRLPVLYGRKTLLCLQLRTAEAGDLHSWCPGQWLDSAHPAPLAMDLKDQQDEPIAPAPAPLRMPVSVPATLPCLPSSGDDLIVRALMAAGRAGPVLSCPAGEDMTYEEEDCDLQVRESDLQAFLMGLGCDDQRIRTTYEQGERSDAVNEDEEAACAGPWDELDIISLLPRRDATFSWQDLARVIDPLVLADAMDHLIACDEEDDLLLVGELMVNRSVISPVPMFLQQLLVGEHRVHAHGVVCALLDLVARSQGMDYDEYRTALAHLRADGQDKEEEQEEEPIAASGISHMRDEGIAPVTLAAAEGLSERLSWLHGVLRSSFQGHSSYHRLAKSVSKQSIASSINTETDRHNGSDRSPLALGSRPAYVHFLAQISFALHTALGTLSHYSDLAAQDEICKLFLLVGQPVQAARLLASAQRPWALLMLAVRVFASANFLHASCYMHGGEYLDLASMPYYTGRGQGMQDEDLAHCAPLPSDCRQTSFPSYSSDVMSASSETLSSLGTGVAIDSGEDEGIHAQRMQQAMAIFALSLDFFLNLSHDRAAAPKQVMELLQYRPLLVKQRDALQAIKASGQPFVEDLLLKAQSLF